MLHSIPIALAEEKARLAIAAADRAEALAEELRESQRQLATLIDNLPGLVYRAPLTPPWILSFVSEGVEPITGVPAARFMAGAITWTDLMHPEDVGEADRKVEKAIAARKGFHIIYRIIRPDGETRWVEERGRAAYGEDGAPRFLEGFIADITERRIQESDMAEERAKRRQAADRLVGALEGTLDGVIALDRQWRITFMNQRAIADHPGGEALLGRKYDQLYPDDGERSFWPAYRGVMEGGPPQTISGYSPHLDAYYEAHVTPGDDGLIIFYRDTTARVRAHEALKASEALNRSIIAASPDCVTLLDRKGALLFINEAGLRAFDLDDASEIIGRKWLDWLCPAARRKAARRFGAALRGREGRLTIFQPTMRGTPKWWDIVLTPVPGESGEAERILVISRDITEQKKVEEKVRWTANHDVLTRLPNRALFQDRLDAQIAEAFAGDGRFALLLLDVDDFKRINDTLGHDAGDALLCAFGDRLRAALRPGDMVARLGGDEFALILTGLASDADVRAAVARLQGKLRQPLVHAGRLLDCQATIGACVYPYQATTRAELLKHADIALYVAKSTARGGCALFEPRMRAETQKRVSMLALARDALSHRRILPFYQPKIQFGSGAIAGFEALLRWRHPRRGVQTPDTIAAAFEDLTLAAEISDRMVEAVIGDMRQWLDRGLEFGHVAINASAAEFRRGDFAERLLARLEAAAIPPQRLQVEVTETVFIGRGAEYVERALKTLSAAGVGIALDDFGTGFASLSHLKQFPVDVLKIDRSFVQNFHDGPDDAAIVRAVINLGKSLNIQIVAEGIETHAQATFLAGHGCDFGQGFLYGRAMPAPRIPPLLKTRRVAPPETLRLAG